MSAANKKYQQLNKQVLGWKARDHLKDKDLELKSKFPLCRGMFENCPSEEELEKSLKGKIALSVCARCPVFQESNVKYMKLPGPRMSAGDMEFYKKIMGKG